MFHNRDLNSNRQICFYHFIMIGKKIIRLFLQVEYNYIGSFEIDTISFIEIMERI